MISYADSTREYWSSDNDSVSIWLDFHSQGCTRSCERHGKEMTSSYITESELHCQHLRFTSTEEIDSSICSLSVQQIARHIVNVHATADSIVRGSEVQDKENWLKRYVCRWKHMLILHLSECDKLWWLWFLVFLLHVFCFMLLISVCVAWADMLNTQNPTVALVCQIRLRSSSKATMSRFDRYCRHSTTFSFSPITSIRLRYWPPVWLLLQQMRQQNDENGGSPIPITVRQLEAIIRISESLARMQL